MYNKDVIGADMPEEISYYPLVDGQASFIIRRNIEEKTDIADNIDGEGTEYTYYTWNEVQLRAPYTREYVESHADDIWRENAPSGVTLEDLAEAVDELAQIVGGM